MTECECLTTCPFFRNLMAGMPTSSNVMKKTYCRGEYTRCARYLVFKTLGAGQVPGNLFPNEITRAREIIEQNDK